jgi:hypothetical protein
MRWVTGVSTAVTTTGTGLWMTTQDLLLAGSMAAIVGVLVWLGLLYFAGLEAFGTWLNHRVEMERVRAESYRIVKTTDAATCGPHQCAAESHQKRTDARAFARTTRETSLADTLSIVRESNPGDDQVVPPLCDGTGKRLKAVPHRHR